MILVVIVFCLLLLNLKYLRFVLKDIGITFSIAGILLAISGLMLYSVASVFVDEFMRQMFIGSIISILRVSLLAHGLLVLVIGIVLIITSVILKSNFKKAHHLNT